MTQYRYKSVQDTLLSCEQNEQSGQPLHHILNAPAYPRQPYALCLDLYSVKSESFLEPRCYSLSLVDGKSVSHHASNDDWLVSNFGKRFFATLANDVLLGAAQVFLKRMNPDNDGETYSFSLCAHGAVIVSHAPVATQAQYGAGSVVGIMLPSKMSNHQKLVAEPSLVACASEIIRFHQYQIDADADTQITLRPA